jgi:hypothetical protein
MANGMIIWLAGGKIVAFVGSGVSSKRPECPGSDGASPTAPAAAPIGAKRRLGCNIAPLGWIGLEPTTNAFRGSAELVANGCNLRWKEAKCAISFLQCPTVSYGRPRNFWNMVAAERSTASA